MQYLLNLYASFSCLAGECPFTCCSGWEIEISKQDYERFGGLEPVWLRKEIFKNIREKGEKHYFKNLKNGDCAMLLEDGLCRIEKHTSEKTLCNTCRKFPRIFGEIGEITAFSMAASCPVVARAIYEDALELFMESPKGFLPVSFSAIPFCREVISCFREKEKIYPEQMDMGQKVRDGLGERFSELSMLLADVLLELLLTSGTYL
ncbi:MAG: flagellin lysine-N-methylase, partial [Lachnospiraceae bacterium]|nr:flagellin lysine-N-methylase [Lachnospiraceae bacterium]